MFDSITRMTKEIISILDGNVHSVWLYGSVVQDDFRQGWSDIDILVLTGKQITDSQAQKLVHLRQILAAETPDNPFFLSFEGVIANLDEYLSGTFSRLVYWGTTGQRITEHYKPDPFSRYELATIGRSVYGSDDRSIFTVPDRETLVEAIRRHYEAIRQYAVRTDEQLYSCGWLLDICRCIYLLRNNDVISKTQAGIWALREHIFPDEAQLKKTIEIRKEPMAYKNRDDIQQWLKGLGPVVQQYADILEQELSREKKPAIRRMNEQDLEPLHRLLSDPAVMRFLEPPYTREQTETFLQKSLSGSPPVYAAEMNGTFIGYVIWHPYEEGSMELGWVLLPEYWGKGFASALTEVLIGRASKEGKRLVIECDPEQKVTGHIALKYGFVRTGSRDGLDVYML